MRTNKIKNEIDEIRKWEEKIKQKDLKYKPNKYLYDFQQFETIRSFGDSVYTGKINIDESDLDQSNLLENMIKLIINLNQNQKKVRLKNKGPLIV